MIKKILIWMIPILALVVGTAAGSLMAPETAAETDAAAIEAEQSQEDAAARHDRQKPEGGEEDGTAAWFSFPNQFFVPLVRRGEIDDMMVLTLTIETTEPAKESVEVQQHRLRDALLRSLIIHANTGGFSGNYTAEAKLQKLRDDLLVAAVRVAGADIRAVLIEDIAATGK